MEERVKILTLRMALRAERGPCPQQEDSPKSGNDGDGSRKESWQEKQVQSEEQFKAPGDMFYFKMCSEGSEEKAMEPHSSTLAWKIPWTEEPGGLQPMGSLGVRHD